MLRLIVLLMFCVLMAPTMQAESLYLPDFKVKMLDGSEFVGHSAVLDSVQLSAYSPSGVQVAFALDDIHSLYRSNGDHSGDGLVIGIAVGALTGIIINTAKDDKTEYKKNEQKGLGMVAGTAALGGLAGLLVGSLWKSWDKVDFSESFKVEYRADRPYLGLTLKF
ncbi:MAG: hypothetical protein OEV49_15370 [candidate division Zixibacteria bacterium]|nr:hypothetical protein [candidate division Zixibacteria bacterium]MDH3936473.1 hypothetical protein [candidate division Zixibacteria bacterium]